MLKTYKYSIVALLIVLLVACDDEFLDYDPIAMSTTESFYNNFESLDFTATTAYGMLSARDVYDIMYSIGYQSASDDVETGGENVNDWPQFQRIDRMTHTKEESDIFATWAYPYKGIRMCNTVLERAEEIREIEIANAKSEQAAKEISDLIDLRVAEMHFLRGFYHFFLVQLYGGVPIIDFLVSPDEFNTPRSSIAEVLHFVQNEFLSAIPVLKEKSALGGDYGRASAGAARALLAKAYLYESSYAENYASDDRFDGCTNQYGLALQYAEEVINSGEYNLVGSTGERFSSWRVPGGQTIGGYRWIFTLDGDNSGESVWEIQNVMDGAGWTKSRGNYITIYTTVRFCYDEDGNAGATAGGWSFNLPSKYMIDAFGNNDARENGLNSAAMAPELDPRFSTTVGRKGDTITGRPNDTILVANNSANGIWLPMDFQNLPTNTISRKYECAPDEYWNNMVNFHDGPMNIRLVRFADVVLMAAEAALKTSDNAKALDYVNQVRTRARMSGETNFPADLTAVSFEDIVHERRLELAMESSRFFDLVRWNLAETFISGITLASNPGIDVNFIKGKHEFFPIPAEEMQLAPGLVQYDAWK